MKLLDKLLDAPFKVADKILDAPFNALDKLYDSLPPNRDDLKDKK